jgi:hypothetical protein
LRISIDPLLVPNSIATAGLSPTVPRRLLRRDDQSGCWYGGRARPDALDAVAVGRLVNSPTNDRPEYHSPPA